ncbi:adenylyltransferase/cytidyltransferase family protein [Amycolatopsis sp. NPDC059090]|uniref:adenylyltransferase/cytidyltransferase family protein n=1 Tax=unclassified Amycolatopsis TaxID=2618356 RepID=UPI003670E2AD
MSTVFWHGTADVPAGWGRSVVALGVFDGLHRGHQRVLEHAVRLGRERGAPVVLTTFDPHPATIAGRPRDTRPVATLEHRADLARSHGADEVLVLSFTECLARTSAEDFVAEVLMRTLHATAVVTGSNFRFGHRGAGDTALLRKLGPACGFTAHAVDLLPGCSSTLVRTLVTTGDLVGAAAVLGRPHRVHGTVEGEIFTPCTTLLPPPGKYWAHTPYGERTVAVEAGLLIADLPDGPTAVDLVGTR